MFYHCVLAVMYLFNVECPPLVRAEAEQSNLKLVNFNIIYRLVEDLQRRLGDLCPVADSEHIVGWYSTFIFFTHSHQELTIELPTLLQAKDELFKSFCSIFDRIKSQWQVAFARKDL